MHLKTHLVDGHVLRTASAKFTACDRKQQSNDLIVIDGADSAKALEAEVERAWDDGEPIQPGSPKLTRHFPFTGRHLGEIGVILTQRRARR